MSVYSAGTMDPEGLEELRIVCIMRSRIPKTGKEMCPRDDASGSCFFSRLMVEEYCALRSTSFPWKMSWKAPVLFQEFLHVYQGDKLGKII